VFLIPILDLARSGRGGATVLRLGRWPLFLGPGRGYLLVSFTHSPAYRAHVFLVLLRFDKLVPAPILRGYLTSPMAAGMLLLVVTEAFSESAELGEVLIFDSLEGHRRMNVFSGIGTYNQT